MAIMNGAGGKKMNPFLTSTLLQCKEKHDECIQPNSKKGFLCGTVVVDRYPSCTCPKTKEATYPMSVCICPADYDPKCGANGITYSNACQANCAGVEVEKDGEC